MLSFLHRWDEEHHDGEQLLSKKKFTFFKKSRYQNTEQQGGCSCNLYIIALQPFTLLQETKNSNLFDKKLYSRETSRERYSTIQHENWLG